ncbi:MSEP-CTERM sorting domain-containing protein [Flavobacterium sp.]|uniref:MSEP-CTERM sorting domain-containing protein n=1 Tax=Flavobacterium sp. TaxID=239 RepID=UPI003B994AED
MLTKSLSPKWIFLSSTLPITILLSILYSDFSIIYSLLSEQNILHILTFGAILILFGMLSAVYAFNRLKNNKDVSRGYSYIAVCFSVLYIILSFIFEDDLIPISLPSWIFDTNPLIYVTTFVMPTLAYGLFSLVVHFTPDYENQSAAQDFLKAIIVPLSTIIIAFLFIFLLNFDHYKILLWLFFAILVTCSLLFLFFLTRGLYIFILKKNALAFNDKIAVLFLFALLLPIAGLLFNNLPNLNQGFESSQGLFGNFSDKFFYIICVFNGVILCIPQQKNRIIQLVLFSCRALTFSFTTYFFFVFLPYLPFALAFLILVIGLFMLAPLILTFVHISVLRDDIQFLKKYYRKSTINLILLLGFIAIPSIVTCNYIYQRNVLQEALDYIYKTDYTKEYDIDTNALEQVFKTIRQNKERPSFTNSNRTPYLSSLYNSIVLNNLTMQEAKLQHLEQIFFGKEYKKDTVTRILNSRLKISKIIHKSTYIAAEKTWKSNVDFEITNNSNFSAAEFETEFELPQGSYISDYYLDMKNGREKGILAEKKSVMWVYSQIVNTRKDPGLLFYDNDSKVGFKIFPFQSNQTRTSGFEIVHKEPLNLNIDGNNIPLGTKTTTEENIKINEFVAYISKTEKLSLPSIKRKPYFHFIIDISNNNEKNLAEYQRRINALKSRYNSLFTNAKISFTNSSIRTVDYDESWIKTITNLSFKGGFYCDSALRKALIQSRSSLNKPVFIILTDDWKKTILAEDYNDYRFCFPDFTLIYELFNDDSLIAHSLIESTKNPCQFESPLENQNLVKYYKISRKEQRLISCDSNPEIVLLNENIDLNNQIKNKSKWKTGVIMAGLRRLELIRPDLSDETWKHMLKSSFESNVMSPATSFIALEEESQKILLKKKQQQVLNGDQSLDLEERISRMSEPSWSLFILCFIFFLVVKRKSLLSKLN